MVIVSACLLGVRCRYDGSHCLTQWVVETLPKEPIIPLCPEQLGGLPTPRAQCDIIGGDGFDVSEGRAKIKDSRGEDRTEAFISGGLEVLKIAKLLRANRAVLKDKSPSCGTKFVSINGEIKEGFGVTGALLKREGLDLITAA